VYRISKLYNVKPEDLCAWNNIQNNSLSLGQVLVIKGAGKTADVVQPAPKVPAAAPVKPEVPVKKEPVKKDPVSPVAPAVPPVVEDPSPAKKVYEENTTPPVSEVGAASVNKVRRDVQESGEADRVLDEPVNPNKYYALHATAPVGTIIMVRNLANDRSVYVKVVGKLEDNDTNRGLVVKLSNSSAEYLKAPNKRFKVELLYGVSLAKGR
jgi:rare lipoprotein A (peptidoglycan hydrolase)